MTPAQCRAARAYLGWSQEALAAQAAVSVETVRNFEAGKRRPMPNNLRAIRGALEAAGIEFTPKGIREK